MFTWSLFLFWRKAMLLPFCLRTQWRKFRWVGEGGGRPPSFRKIGNLSEIFGFVGILKTIEYTQKFRKSYWREWLFIDLIIFRLFSSSMLAVLLCTLGQPWCSIDPNFEWIYLWKPVNDNLWNVVENQGVLKLCQEILKSSLHHMHEDFGNTMFIKKGKNMQNKFVGNSESSAPPPPPHLLKWISLTAWCDILFQWCEAFYWKLPM